VPFLNFLLLLFNPDRNDPDGLKKQAAGRAGCLPA
jgi:hypothetical protein